MIENLSPIDVEFNRLLKVQPVCSPMTDLPAVTVRLVEFERLAQIDWRMRDMFREMNADARRLLTEMESASNASLRYVKAVKLERSMRDHEETLELWHECQMERAFESRWG